MEQSLQIKKMSILFLIIMWVYFCTDLYRW